MKKITFFLALMAAASFSRAQNGLENIVVEKYYQTNAADSTNASNNSSATELHKGSIVYRVFVDMAPGYKFIQMFGNTDALSGNVLHPMVITTTTDFFNDPNNGQVYPQGNSVVNTKKNTTLIDSWLSVGGVCAGKMGVLKTEDTDGSIGNSNGVLMNNPGGAYGVPINSVIANAQDGLLPGSPITPNALGTGTTTDIFDQTPGNTFSLTNGAIAGLGGVMGVTPSNMVLIGQFTTNGVLCFSLNIQISNTVTNVAEVYVPNNPQQGEFVFAGLAYCASIPTNTNVGVGISEASQETSSLFSVYPNPSKGLFTIAAANIAQPAAGAYEVYDVSGRMIIAKQLGEVSGSVTETVDMTDLTAGLYFMKVTIGDAVCTKRIVKE